VAAHTPTPHTLFFLALGARLKKLRTSRGWRQEDMISYGFSLRHWQRIEAGKHPISVKTLLKISDAFKLRPETVIASLYKKR
jgi:transcriptional regulator with XRE-family HTH domain